MPRKVHCAKCGYELSLILKALPQQQITVTLVEPHKCLKETKKNPYKDNNNEIILKDKTAEEKKGLNEVFASFEFNKSLGGVNPDIEADDTTVFNTPMDKRPAEDLVDTIAPTGVIGAIKDGFKG